MSTTVAATLIATLGTLAGGCIALLVARTQNNTQIKLAEIQRAEQQLIEKRQIRREAYLQFLNHFSAMERTLEELWQSPSPDENELLTVTKPVLDSINEVNRMLNLVRLEGPPTVYAAAANLAGHTGSEFRALAKVAKRREEGRVIMLGDENAYLEAKEMRSKLKQDFVDAAQTGMNEWFIPTLTTNTGCTGVRFRRRKQTDEVV